MKQIIRITKSIVSFFVVALASCIICALFALLIMYVFGITDSTIRVAASIMLFGTILVALVLGAFDD